MKVSCLNLPPTIYTVSALTGSNSFYIGRSNPDIRIDISSGSYSGNNIANTITNALPTDFSDITLTFSEITGQITFKSTSDLSFSLDFNYIDPSNCPNTFSKIGSNIYKDQLTLGWLLGFRKDYKYYTPQETITNCNTINNLQNASSTQLRMLSKVHTIRPTLTPVKQDGYQYLQKQYRCYTSTHYTNDISYVYSGVSSYTGEAVYNAHGNKYFLLSINDFQNNHTNSVISPLQEETLGDGNILAKSSSSCCTGGCGIETPTRIYFGPTDISKLHIKLYDEFGRIVDMNNSDFSITLEVEILYDL